MKNKKTLKIVLLILLIIILIILTVKVFSIIFRNNCDSNCLEFANKNQKTVFSINKCVLFSNCSAKNKENSTANFTIENLYQYTDIALFINNNSDEYNLENTLKSVKINNLQYIQNPDIGKPALFYKNINSFAEGKLLDKNPFEDEIEFNISSENNTDLSDPTLYNNCANPIVLSYINQNLKKDYTIADNSSSISYDGSLLQKCGILLNSLNSKFSFDIYITNNLDQEFKCTVYIEPPLNDGSKSLTDGAITQTLNTNYTFYRIK